MIKKNKSGFFTLQDSSQDSAHSHGPRDPSAFISISLAQNTVSDEAGAECMGGGSRGQESIQ